MTELQIRSLRKKVFDKLINSIEETGAMGLNFKSLSLDYIALNAIHETLCREEICVDTEEIDSEGSAG